MNSTVGVPHGEIHVRGPSPRPFPSFARRPVAFPYREGANTAFTSKLGIAAIHIVDFMRQEGSTIERTIELMQKHFSSFLSPLSSFLYIHLGQMLEPSLIQLHTDLQEIPMGNLRLQVIPGSFLISE